MKKALFLLSSVALVLSLSMFYVSCSKNPAAPLSGPAQAPINLGTAARFAILSDQALTDIPTSSIKGDVGLSPGQRSDITGLLDADGQVTLGAIYAADDGGLEGGITIPDMLINAKNDARDAYLYAVAAERGTATSISGNINGLTLYPGLYESLSSIEISPAGKLYLDGQGDINAVFVIRSSTSITTESTSEVVLSGGAQANNILWVAGFRNHSWNKLQDERNSNCHLCNLALDGREVRRQGADKDRRRPGYFGSKYNRKTVITKLKEI